MYFFLFYLIVVKRATS